MTNRIRSPLHPPMHFGQITAFLGHLLLTPLMAAAVLVRLDTDAAYTAAVEDMMNTRSE